MQEQINNFGDFGQFIKQKHNEILALAGKCAQEIGIDVAQKENALMDFEILLGVDLDEEVSKELSKESKVLRLESWKELSKKHKNNFNKMMEELDSF